MLKRSASIIFIAFTTAALVASCAEGDVGFGDDDDGNGGSASCADQGLDECGDLCVNLQSDSLNCGSCGFLCSASAICSNANCVTCPQTFAACDGECIDPATSTDHCGGCGNACLTEQTCTNYTCQCPPPAEECNDTCVNYYTDVNNCGQCGNVCEDEQLCASGQCKLNCGSETECNGTCVDLYTNMDHCGQCSNACDPVAETCAGGSCNCIPGICGACGVVDAGSTVPQSLNGSNVGSPDQLSPGCTSGGPEVAYTFTAATDGTYLFDTLGSGMDTVLSLRDSSCAEIGCNDDAAGTLQSQVIAVLMANDQVVVIVEGFSGDTGSFTLNIALAPPCPTNSLGNTVPANASGTTMSLADIYDPACESSDSNEATYSFTAPATDTYAFYVTNATFDTVLEVRDATCSGSSLACDSNNSSDAVVLAPLTQGQTVVVMVDGYFGDVGTFDLTVDLAPACPAQDLGSTVPQTVGGTTVGGSTILAPSCSSSNAEEATYSFTAPSAGVYMFDTVGSTIDTVLQVLDGDCTGLVLGCNDDYSGTDSSVGLVLAANQTVVLHVDGATAGAFVLNVSPGPSCPEIDLGSTSPQTVNGSTVGKLSLHDGTCNSGGSPEVVYSFTAPAAGTFTFDTVGSPYDTVLYVRDVDCSGMQLDCNDDDQGLTSTVNVTLTMGQVVAVFVDGFSGDSGAYTLNVSGP